MVILEDAQNWKDMKIVGNVNQLQEVTNVLQKLSHVLLKTKIWRDVKHAMILQTYVVNVKKITY
jgi:hypothetical protein